MEPEWSACFEPNSYGFRPGRSTHDAIEAIFTAIKQKSKFVLDADLAKCFDKINQEKLLAKLQTYPKLRKQIKAWLKSGVMNDKTLFPTDEGTPQGGAISRLLSNIALHGMEERVKQYAETLKGGKRDKRKSLSLIRYADDFVILHERLEVILDYWLAEIGLELKPSKTKVTHTLNNVEGNVGFDFLGFTRQYLIGKNPSGKDPHGNQLGFKTLVTPSKNKVKLHIQKIGETIANNKASTQMTIIKEVNPIIRGWYNYYSTGVSKETYSYCDQILYQQLRPWTRRRHPNKNAQWVKTKYWHSEGNRNWVFSTSSGYSAYKLLRHSDTKVIRHTKVEGNRSPFDGDLTYSSIPMGLHPEMPPEKAFLLNKQKGKCAYCGLHFLDGDL